jgi:hypothetical protein
MGVGWGVGLVVLGGDLMGCVDFIFGFLSCLSLEVGKEDVASAVE